MLGLCPRNGACGHLQTGINPFGVTRDQGKGEDGGGPRGTGVVRDTSWRRRHLTWDLLSALRAAPRPQALAVGIGNLGFHSQGSFKPHVVVTWWG